MSDDKKPRSFSPIADAFRKSNEDMKQRLVTPLSVTPVVSDPLAGMRELMEAEANIEQRRNNPAGWMYERLVSVIRDFEASLDPTQEIGGRLASGLGERTFHIVNIGYLNPDMLIFKGVDPDSRPVQLVQHHSQLSIMLMALPARNREPLRIGFLDHSQK